MRKALSMILVILLVFSSIPLHALELSDIDRSLTEAELRQAIKGDDLWENNYPNGLINFVGTQFSVSENDQFLEIAIARQGGVAGDISIDFKAIDISAEYGKDYVIRVYENSRRAELESNEDSVVLIDSLLADPEINISDSESFEEDDENDDSEIPASENSSYDSEENSGDNQTVLPSALSIMDNSYAELEGKTVDFGEKTVPKTLRELRENTLNRESDRPYWRDLDAQKVEQMKEDYDEFFLNVPGTETTIEFKDGEYIKYIYILPIDDDISESQEQILFALTNPTGGAVRGEFYMAYANIEDNDEFENSLFEFVEDSVIAEQDFATVTVRRSGGEQQYASVYVGTEQGTAVPGLDYSAGLQELLFTPGMTEQKVIVDILNNPNRVNSRDFVIALDLSSENTNMEKSRVNVTVPAIVDNLSTIFTQNISANETIPNDLTTSSIYSMGVVDSPVALSSDSIGTMAGIFDARGVEKITNNGYSQARGQWTIAPNDFRSGSTKGSVSVSGDQFRINITGGEGASRFSGIKLYGANTLSYNLSNTGSGREWYQRQWHPWWKNVRHEEKEYSTTIGVAGSLAHMTRAWTRRGSFSNISGTINIEYNHWDTDMIYLTTFANSGNNSLVSAKDIRVSLKEYTLQVQTDSTNVPEFIRTEYDVKNNALSVKSTSKIGQPGSLYIKSIYSNVNNQQTNMASNTRQKGVFRSDKIEFGYTANNNEAGKIMVYDGFEVYNGSKWIKYTGNTLSIDEDFFKQSGMSINLFNNSIIQVRPVFKPAEVTLKINVDTANGYLENLGESVASSSFELKSGDSVNLKAVGNVVAKTPVWRANNQSGLTMLDSTGADNRIKYKVDLANDQINVSFNNPTLIVQAEPMEYRHNISQPVYYIDGVRYNSSESLHQKMEDIFKLNSDNDPSNDVNPLIKIEFNYVFDYPDLSERIRFGDPGTAYLRVYKNDGTLRAEYPSVRNANSPAGYTANSNKGSYSYSGYLKDLGWKSGDYASVIVYGSGLNYDGSRMTTNENAIDFLDTTGNAITLEDENGKYVAGNVYKPITIKNADPFHSYELRAYPNPGYSVKWVDTSGDFDGDGQESNDDGRLAKKLEAQGFNLDYIRATNSMYGRTYTGNFFSYAPQFFDPSKVYYQFVKQAAPGSSNYGSRIILTESYRTVLDPDSPAIEKPIQGATIIVGNKSYITDEFGIAAIWDQYFPEKGSYYSAQIVHKGFEYFTYVRAGYDTPHLIDTSNTMRPYNFSAQFFPPAPEDKPSSPEAIKLDKANRYVPIKNGETEFKFKVNSGAAGVIPNNAIIRVYDVNLLGNRSGDPVYEVKTGQPSGGVFTHSFNLLDAGLKPGQKMTISPLYMSGTTVVREYPEVDVGLTFSQNLNIISVPASFNTPLQPTVAFIGKMNNRFDLGMDMDLESFLTPGTRLGEDGIEYNTRTISFGYSKDYEKKFGDQRDEAEKKKDLEGNPQAKAMNDTAKKLAGSTGSTFKFEFEVALSLTIEQGQFINSDGLMDSDGYYYFSSMVMMAKGKAGYEAKYTYVTPIGVPVFASINIAGEASVVLAIEANDSERHVAKYRFDNDGSMSLNPKNYSIYTQFYVSPSITIGAGVGAKMLNTSISGTATGDFNFTMPITGENQSSSGSGGLVFSAAVGIKVLFIQKKWTIYESERIELFGYGTESQAIMSALNDPYTSYLYSSVGVVEEDEILSRDYLDNRSEWLESSQLPIGGDFSAFSMNSSEHDEAIIDLNNIVDNETLLLTGMYPYPQTKLVELGKGKILMLFINDSGSPSRDSLNRAQLFYSFYNGSIWSLPQPVDTDDTWDEAPDAFVIEDKVLIIWSDAHRQFTEEDTAKDVLQAMNISARWFNINSVQLGEKFAITKEINDPDADNENFFVDSGYADVNPHISYDEISGRLMVYYTKIDYEDTWDYEPVLKDDGSSYDEDVVYGDLANGYSTIAYRFAERDGTGNFIWNDDYDRPVDTEKGYTEANGYSAEYFYGQRFVDLAVDIDIVETEEYYTQDGELKVRTIQNIPERQPALTNDPLVVDSDITTYNGLALHAYTLDTDGNNTTTEDQEIYLQIYNYELDGFVHPIRLTVNNHQDSKPQFVRTGNITYLYWISDGDIVYMDITNLVRNNLKAVSAEVEIGRNAQNEAIYAVRDYYLIDKSNTAKDAYINTAVSSREDYPIDEFIIRSNNRSQYLLYTDYVISYKDGLQPGDPGTEKLENIIREKHIFAAYSEPGAEISNEVIYDAYTDNEDFEYIYSAGKSAGTYPEKIKLKQDITDSETVDDLNRITQQSHPSYAAETEINLDYKIVPDINGFTGVVKAGDPVVLQEYKSDSDVYKWSVPVQMTFMTGANYSDIDFIVNGEQNIQAVYIRYHQSLDSDNIFVEDLNNRMFASNIFTIDSTISGSDMILPEELAQPNTLYEFSMEIANSGIKPLKNIKYISYITQNGKMLLQSSSSDIINLETVFAGINYQDGAVVDYDDMNSDARVLLGGHSYLLNGGFVLPADLKDLTIGFKVTDDQGNELLKSEQDIRAEHDIKIHVLSSLLTSKNNAAFSLYVTNEGNMPYSGNISVNRSDTGSRLARKTVNLAPGEAESIIFDIKVNESMFGKIQTASDGSMYDAIDLTVNGGDFSINADIRRTASSELAGSYNNVKQFTISNGDVSIDQGDMIKLNAVQSLRKAIPDEIGNPLKTRWISSDSDIAVVLQDGTVLGLEEGYAIITAVLEPDIGKLQTHANGILMEVDETYKIPTSLIQRRSVVVKVGQPKSQPPAIDDFDKGGSDDGSGLPPASVDSDQIDQDNNQGDQSDSNWSGDRGSWSDSDDEDSEELENEEDELEEDEKDSPEAVQPGDIDVDRKEKDAADTPDEADKSNTLPVALIVILSVMGAGLATLGVIKRKSIAAAFKNLIAKFKKS